MIAHFDEDAKTEVHSDARDVAYGAARKYSRTAAAVTKRIADMMPTHVDVE